MSRASAPNRRRQRPAFTLIETAMAIVVIGVGVIAMVDAQAAFMHSNAWSTQAATATFLANEVRELTRHLPRHDPVTGLYFSNGQLVGWGPEPGEVSIDDFNDLDDFDGLQFGGPGADFEGPINGVGEVIYEVNPDGTIRTDPNTGDPIPMLGWSQRVIVEKVDPFNLGNVRPNWAVDPPNGSFPGRAVDEFPLRITVIVTYQSPMDASPSEVARVMWIVP